MIANNISTEIEFYITNFKMKRANGSPTVKKILKEGLMPRADDGIEIFVGKKRY
jgi:hypothetical protein